MRVYMQDERFTTLEEEELEESNEDEPLFGVFLSNEGSIYSYMQWFYDDDESAFTII